MNGKIHIIVIHIKSTLLALAGAVICLAVIGGMIVMNSNNETAALQQQSEGYTILAMNDIGMHCYDSDFSSFLVLPPYNTIKAQIFKKGAGAAELVNKDIVVTYEILNNTYSTGKTNFWVYAKDYGYDVPPNIGVTGNGLKGQFRLSADGKYYEATAIPLTPYNDGSKVLNPYQLVHIRVKDKKTGELLAETDDVVAPVSDEMLCSNCHGKAGTDLNILKAHDTLSGTRLVSDLMEGKRYKCSDCHKDNILGQPGKSNVLPLSQAMHGFHADKMTLSNVSPKCYNCHPGPVTQCYRSIMYSAGVNCVDSKCHGDMANVAKTQAEGRQAWLEEPNCSNCHDAAYSANLNTLYRNSYLQNGPCIEMNNLILCESCHNSPHAEWKSANEADNLLPVSLLGYASYINQCAVCHQGSGRIHTVPQ